MDPRPTVEISELDAPAAAPRRHRGRTLAFVGAGTLAVVVVAAGVSTAAGSAAPTGAKSAASPSSSASAKGTHKGGPRGHGFGMNAIHSESTVKKSDGTYQVIDTQRGAVTAVSATSISLKSDDGFTATYVVDSSTKVRDTTNKVIGDITVGETVQVVATKTDSADTATTVGVPMAHTKKAAASSAPAAG